jgi:Fur family transcriptional regulator, ferric uptake regulator
MVQKRPCEDGPQFGCGVGSARQQRVSRAGRAQRTEQAPSSDDTGDLRPEDRLSNVGLKITTPRLRVLKIFLASERRHLMPQEVYRITVEQQGARLALGTVYRILGQLTDFGILSRNVFKPGQAVYELARVDDHDHLICVDCDRVDEFVDREIETRLRVIAESRGYVIAYRRHALYGYCRECRTARSAKKKATKKK